MFRETKNQDGPHPVDQGQPRRKLIVENPLVEPPNEEKYRMPIRQELIDLLVCPETRQPLSMASDELLAQLNARIRAGELRNRGGDPVASELAAGLLRKDGKVLYPIQDDIPVMLIEESIELR